MKVALFVVFYVDCATSGAMSSSLSYECVGYDMVITLHPVSKDIYIGMGIYLLI